MDDARTRHQTAAATTAEAAPEELASLGVMEAAWRSEVEAASAFAAAQQQLRQKRALVRARRAALQQQQALRPEPPLSER